MPKLKIKRKADTCNAHSFMITKYTSNVSHARVQFLMKLTKSVSLV